MRTLTLKRMVLRSLREQGFRLKGGQLLPPSDQSKENLRRLHQTAVAHKLETSKPGLARHEKNLIQSIASGPDVIPEEIRPVLVQVQSDSRDELLFRYATLHWSIPVSSGYGRRLRFLVMDRQNDKLIGVIGLGDPVFSLAKRDSWIGWTQADRRERLHHVMEAFVLGSVPPYSHLLCGKLVAMLAASNEVREAFGTKYAGQNSVIRQRQLAGQLVSISTASALGRSSVYNRLTFRERKLFHSVGYTQGSGEFHFANGLYKALYDYAVENCNPTAKSSLWGKGFRSRREIVKKALPALGLPGDWLYHGVKREVFVVPLAENAKQFLRGEDAQPIWHNQPAEDLFEWFQQRWLLPRAEWDRRYLNFERDSFRIWPPES